MAIEFNPIMSWESGYPLYFSGELKEYDVLNDGDYTMEYQNDFVVSYMNVNNPPYSAVAFRGVQTSHGFVHSHVVGNPVAWSTKNLFKVLLGQNSEGVKVELIGTILAGDQSASYVDWFLTLQTRISGPNQATVTTTISNESGLGLLYAPASAGNMLTTEYAFGCGLLKIPGRPDTLDQRCLVFFFGNNCSDNNIDYVNLSRYSTDAGGARRYDVRPRQNANSHPSINDSKRTLGCIVDLAKIAELYSVDVDIKVYSPEAGEPSGPDGMKDPSFDGSSDTIEIPDAPTTELVNMGFYHVYQMSLSGLNHLGHYVFG